MATLKFLGMDFGASNGRGVLGSFDGSTVKLEEVHRFENHYTTLNGIRYWDIISLFDQIKQSIYKATHDYGAQLSGVAIDTFGVDYGLLDKNGQLLGNVISYRYASQEDVDAVHAIIPDREIFEHVGTTSIIMASIYQIHGRKRRGDVAYQNAETLLFLPDLMAYFLTGEKGTEYTFSTTSNLYNPRTRDWDDYIIDKLGLNRKLFTRIDPSCTQRGTLLQDLQDELRCGPVPFLLCGEHDTACAVAAVPATGGDDYAYLSSGTWSLMGFESDVPLINDDVFHLRYSNEGTIQGAFRPLRNIMGLWVIQECRREWMANHNTSITWDEVVDAARQAPAFRSILDIDHPTFFSSGHMIGAIQDYCAQTKQPILGSIGEIARAVYESLALKYRVCIESMEKIRGKKVNTLHIMGGGSRNRMLNQFSADALGIPVLAGPIECTGLGNVLCQAMAVGEIANLGELREVVRRSCEIETYTPNQTQAWQDAYGKLQELMEV